MLHKSFRRITYVLSRFLLARRNGCLLGLASSLVSIVDPHSVGRNVGGILSMSAWIQDSHNGDVRPVLTKSRP